MPGPFFPPAPRVPWPIGRFAAVTACGEGGGGGVASGEAWATAGALVALLRARSLSSPSAFLALLVELLSSSAIRLLAIGRAPVLATSSSCSSPVHFAVGWWRSTPNASN